MPPPCAACRAGPEDALASGAQRSRPVPRARLCAGGSRPRCRHSSSLPRVPPFIECARRRQACRGRLPAACHEPRPRCHSRGAGRCGATASARSRPRGRGGISSGGRGRRGRSRRLSPEPAPPDGPATARCACRSIHATSAVQAGAAAAEVTAWPSPRAASPTDAAAAGSPASARKRLSRGPCWRGRCDHSRTFR
jgi:hypothetical protein